METATAQRTAAPPLDVFAGAVAPGTMVELTPQQPVPAQQIAAQAGQPDKYARLIELAMSADKPDLEFVKRLLDLEAEVKAARAKEAFDEDFAKFTGRGLVVPKTKLVKQKKRDGTQGPAFWQSEYEHVTAMLKPALGECGFGFHVTPVVKRNGVKVEWVDVTATLTHRLGHERSITLGGPPDDSGSKNPSQEIQSTITFWSRHSLLAITGTAQEGKDNDGRGARGYQEDGNPEEGPKGDDELQRLVDEGNAEADKGEAALNTWWGFLTQQQRNGVMPYFSGMKAAARKATRGG